MNRKEISFEYDPDVDAAYLTLMKATIAETEEVCPGIVVDFDDSKQIVGIEILRITKRFKPGMRAK